MLEALQLETIRNLHWAISFSIATGLLNIVSIVLALRSARNMRRASGLWREAVARGQTPSGKGE